MGDETLPLAQPTMFSHGTLEVRDMDASKRFFTEFLGLECTQHVREACAIGLGGPWIVACVLNAKATPQTLANRWELTVDGADEVDAAHRAAHAHRASYGIEEILPVRQEGGARSFCLRDLNGNWWEIAHRPGRLFDAAFAAGDVA